MGRCPECGANNSLVEQVAEPPRPARQARQGLAHPVALSDLADSERDRRSTGIGEFDRVLGGGIVPGAVALVSGDPGIGKSTLLLQVAHSFTQGNSCRALYVSGEESAAQLRMRSGRVGASSPGVLVLAETDMEAIEGALAEVNPSLAVVDSIQTLYDPELESGPGTVSQIRHCAGRLMRLAKETGLPVFLVGHVTKEGAIAGPRVLEHMVDTVLYLEGDRHLDYRLLRAVKNRFGSTNELGIFEMRQEGMAEVQNPSAAFLDERQAGRPGSAVVAVMEGTRPLLVEVQALVSPAPPFGSPRRAMTGLDRHRCHLVLAVLEKRAGLHLATQDVYANIPGGVRITEPAADLGVALAVASSLKDRPLRADTVFFGEVGLTGEVRAVSQPQRRLQEAFRLGFGRCVAPRGAKRGGKQAEEVVEVRDLDQAFEAALE